jgi:hypothetical protein
MADVVKGGAVLATEINLPYPIILPYPLGF